MPVSLCRIPPVWACMNLWVFTPLGSIRAWDINSEHGTMSAGGNAACSRVRGPPSPPTPFEVLQQTSTTWDATLTAGLPLLRGKDFVLTTNH